MTETAQAPGNTFVLSVAIPGAWPVAEPTLAGRFNESVGTVELYFLQGARLMAQLSDANGPQVSVVSGQIGVWPGMTVKIAVRVAADGEIAIAASGMIIARSSDADLQGQFFELQPADIHDELPDLVQRNLAAIAARSAALAARAPRSGRQPMPAAYAEAGLRRELDQMADLLLLCHKGALHHVYGLSARLRLLIGRGKNATPLLQLVAAHKGLPLNLNALRSSNEIDPKITMAFGNWTPAPAPSLVTSSIDLDVWLELTGAVVDSQPYTNNKIVRAIADTVGAHFDPDLEPLVGYLERSHSGTDQGVFSEMERWVINLSVCVQDLGTAVLA